MTLDIHPVLLLLPSLPRVVPAPQPLTRSLLPSLTHCSCLPSTTLAQSRAFLPSPRFITTRATLCFHPSPPIHPPSPSSTSTSTHRHSLTHAPPHPLPSSCISISTVHIYYSLSTGSCLALSASNLTLFALLVSYSLNSRLRRGVYAIPRASLPAFDLVATTITR